MGQEDSHLAVRRLANWLHPRRGPIVIKQQGELPGIAATRKFDLTNLNSDPSLLMECPEATQITAIVSGDIDHRLEARR